MAEYTVQMENLLSTLSPRQKRIQVSCYESTVGLKLLVAMFLIFVGAVMLYAKFQDLPPDLAYASRVIRDIPLGYLIYYATAAIGFGAYLIRPKR